MQIQKTISSRASFLYSIIFLCAVNGTRSPNIFASLIISRPWLRCLTHFVRDWRRQLSSRPIRWKIILQKCFAFFPLFLRSEWDSNPRPPPWQGGALTSWATTAYFYKSFSDQIYSMFTAFGDARNLLIRAELPLHIFTKTF